MARRTLAFATGFYGFVFEKTSDWSSNSSTGSVLTPGALCSCCNDIASENPAARSVPGVCDRNMVVAAANRAIAANAEIIRRFIGKLRGVRCRKKAGGVGLARNATQQ